MRAHILVSNIDGRRCLYVPEAHIQFYAVKGRDNWVLCTFRTDGYWGLKKENLIPTVDYLRQSHQFTTEIDVPQHIVEFAVENERRRQEAVGDIAEALETAIRTGNRRDIFKGILTERNQEKLDDEFGEETENKIAEEINILLSKSGGLQ